jgi:predicted CXXCH cytochrome family protein
LNRRHALLGVGLGLAAAAASCARATPSATPSVERRAASASAPSNALRGDYVGSAACARCHAEEHEAWSRSAMHRMTRNADATDVRAPFDGTALRFKDDVVTLESRGGQRFVRIARPPATTELYRVTRNIGGRQREDFAGVRVLREDDPKPASEELILPVSYLIFSHSLRYKGYSVLVHERQYARAGPVWNQTCLFCHNTVPFFSTVLGALAGPRPPSYQAANVDALLPRDRQWRWQIADEGALAGAVSDEIDHLGGTRARGAPGDLVKRAILTTRARFEGDDAVEIGIGCESCHNGGREHARDPSVPPSFVPHTAAIGVTTPPPKDAAAARSQAIDRVCARCHQVLFTRYPWTWEGGLRQSATPGGSPINSGEARDFLLGGCASALACTACHDPHDARDRRAREQPLATPAGNTVCTRCHAALASEPALRAHAHHDPRGAGGACVACHMPRKNMGLDTRLTRYHRIGSPTDPERVLMDRPLECALCHADKSVESLVSTMERYWHKDYSRDLLIRLYGDLQSRPLLSTLERGKPHERAIAAAVLGERHEKSAAPLIAQQLVNEYPLVRAFAAAALTDAIGKDCNIDVAADVSRVAGDARACLASVGLRDLPWPPSVAPAAKGDADLPDD